MYQRKVDVDMLNTVKSVLADVSLALRQSKAYQDKTKDYQVSSFHRVLEEL